MRYTLVTLALAALSMGSPVPDTGAASYPPVFKISNVVHGGTGCPQGSIDVDWSSSRVFPICMFVLGATLITLLKLK